MAMDQPGSRLLTIGELSRLSLISVRMLRYYDQHGVLSPVEVDAASGYRYYSAEQLVTTSRIRTLRDVGCSVAQIREPLPTFTDPGALRLGLEYQRIQLEADAVATRERIGRIDHLITQLTEVAMSIEVTRTTLPAMTVAALRDVIPTYTDESLLWKRLMPAIEAAGAVLADPPACGATFHDDEHKESDVDVEVWEQVAAPFTPAGDVRCVEVPEREVAMAVLRGSYDGIGAVFQELGTWVSRNDVRIVGPAINIYRVSPAQDSDPAHWVTEVCLPIG